MRLAKSAFLRLRDVASCKILGWAGLSRAELANTKMIKKKKRSSIVTWAGLSRAELANTKNVLRRNRATSHRIRSLNLVRGECTTALYNQGRAEEEEEEGGGVKEE